MQDLTLLRNAIYEPFVVKSHPTVRSELHCTHNRCGRADSSRKSVQYIVGASFRFVNTERKLNKTREAACAHV